MADVPVAQSDDRPGSPRFAPVDLDDAPGVDAFLRRLGLGPFDRSTLTAPTGRNDVWAGPTACGEKVLVKRVIGSDGDVRGRMGRSLAFERFAHRVLCGAVDVPTFLGADEDGGHLAFRYLDGARSGAELMVDEVFDDDLAHIAGTMLGLLHDHSLQDALPVGLPPPLMPSPGLLVGIPHTHFDQLSFGEIQAWRLVQQDRDLVDAVTSLIAAEAEQPRVPAHCDLRLDQFLLSGGRLYLSDWEEFRAADAARDVGGFAGEWLYRSVLDIVTTRGGAPVIDAHLTHEDVLERGATNLRRLSTRVRSFWDGYRSVRATDPDLARRATAFAGLHLLDRLIVGAGRSSRLSGIERAAAGIGRAALLDPDRHGDTIGLGGTA